MGLREDLASALEGRVAVVGIGNADLGDDGAGVRLAEALAARGVPDVLPVDRTPEHWFGRLMREPFDVVLFLDAVEAGLPAGDVVFMDAATIEARFPQVSTHRLSLGVLARLLHTDGGTRTWLVGIQPQSLAPDSALSPPVAQTVAALLDLLTGVLAEARARPLSLDPRPVALRPAPSDLGPRTSDFGLRGAHP